MRFLKNNMCLDTKNILYCCHLPLYPISVSEMYRGSAILPPSHGKLCERIFFLKSGQGEDICWESCSLKPSLRGRVGCFSLRCVGDWNSANARARVLCGPGLGGSGWGCSSECVESHLLSPDCCGLQMHCAPFLRPTTWASQCSVASLRCSFSRIKMD